MSYTSMRNKDKKTFENSNTNRGNSDGWILITVEGYT